MRPDAGGEGRPASARSFSAVLDVLARHVPPTLLAPGLAQALSRSVARLPAELSDWEYLECWLGADAPRMDVILGVSDTGRRILADREPAIPLTLANESRTWAGLRALARAWDSAPFADAIQRIWLELDLGGCEGDPIVAPGVFLDFSEESCHPPERLLDVLGQSIAILTGAPLEGATHRVLRHALEHLPAGAFAPFFGLFPGRPGAGLRVCIAGLRPIELPPYLADIGWPGEPDELRALLEEIAALPGGAPEPLLLHLDFAPALRPRIGLELVFQREPQVRGGFREASFLAWLERLGLLTPDSAVALQAWPGVSVEHFPHELWPSLLHRLLNHVKLLIEPGLPPRAKAYLACHHVPRPRRPAGP
jgi:hypothetical protein